MTLKAFDPLIARKRCMSYRRRILEISQQVQALHAAGAFSCLEMVDVIYNGLMRGAAGNSLDTFMMSKGHGCMAQYVILEDLGILSRRDLDLYCKPEGRLGCHPDYGVPGIEASTGSLGHGMGLATGMAYTERHVNKGDGLIFTVLSDGELQEGSTWECMMMAANLEVDNLICFLDHNGMQSFGNTVETHPRFYPIREKLEAFNWETAEVNGHDAAAIFDAVTRRKGDRPFMLIGNTVKGRGVSYMEGGAIWHYRSPNPEEYAQALAELTEISS
ncbi:transketolase [Thalassospiraceae bacterium LMO-SO8]|nr:transketolase [Alphaproteobacteria bacterium LMO-S08]WND77653.1 transketolase [Thalassospiraceae bacterium LMO-SO8]